MRRRVHTALPLIRSRDVPEPEIGPETIAAANVTLLGDAVPTKGMQLQRSSGQVFTFDGDKWVGGARP